MGVWIETPIARPVFLPFKSHPVWVCGLKLQIQSEGTAHHSHTLYGCVD